MKGKQLENVGNHVHEGGGEATNCGLNQLTKKFTFGDIVWVKIRDSSWWPAQVVDEKSKSGSNDINKTLEGRICVRLYGSYNYMHVDPMKYRTEFENVLKQNNWNFRDILMKALEQDLSRVKSRAKFKRKAYASEESPTAEASKVQKQKQDKIQKNEKDEIAQRKKATESSHLAEKAGNDSCKSEMSKRQKANTRHKADGPDSVRASLGKPTMDKQGNLLSEQARNKSDKDQRSAPYAVEKIHKDATALKGRLKQSNHSVEKTGDEHRKGKVLKKDFVKKIKKSDAPDSATGSLKTVEELSARQVKVMQSLGLMAPCGSPFHRNGLHKIAIPEL